MRASAAGAEGMTQVCCRVDGAGEEGWCKHVGKTRRATDGNAPAKLSFKAVARPADPPSFNTDIAMVRLCRAGTNGRDGGHAPPVQND